MAALGALGMTPLSLDQAIVFTFLHLSKECPEQCANITMDIEAEQWKGGLECALVHP